MANTNIYRADSNIVDYEVLDEELIAILSEQHGRLIVINQYSGDKLL
jgi:hypothetical protein